MSQVVEVNPGQALDLVDNFLRGIYYDEVQHASESSGKSLVIDFEVLDKFSPELADFLLHSPDTVLKYFNDGLSKIDLSQNNLNIRLTNLPDTNLIKIRDLRSEHIGKFLALDGVIKTSSEVRPVAKSVVFECPGCSREIVVKQNTSKLVSPGGCSCGRKNNFKILSENFVDTVSITLEESPETLEGGEQPKRVVCYLREDLVSPVREKDILPGNKIRIIGVLKEYPVILSTGGRSTRYDLLVQTNNIDSIERDFEKIEISEGDEEEIIALASDPKIYERLANSITPTVLGYEKIKQALVMLIFGGVRKVKVDGTASRGDIHVLLVGDPGVGKSMMLTYMSKLAPKAVYVTGKGTSAAGLTATVVKDDFSKDWILEAGALVLANKGIAIIDELDKMGHEDRVAMHEAMAQQTVTINKANIHATLNAQSSVLAAANPVLGRFNPSDSISKQINLPPTLINRFDLIFPIRDIPDPKKDELIAKHVLEHHRDSQNPPGLIEKALLRKYVAYAKQKCKPKLTKDAMREISDFYVKLRNKNTSSADGGLAPIPITARQLDALIRLSESSAKIQLRSDISVLDARRAIELLNHSMEQVGIDPETGELDIDQLLTGTTTSQRNRVLILKQVLDELSGEMGDIPLESIISRAGERGIDKDRAEELVEKMMKNGELFSPRNGVFRKAL